MDIGNARTDFTDERQARGVAHGSCRDGTAVHQIDHQVVQAVVQLVRKLIGGLGYGTCEGSRSSAGHCDSLARSAGVFDVILTEFNSPHFVVVDKAADTHNIWHQNIDVTPLIMAFDIMHGKVIAQ